MENKNLIPALVICREHNVEINFVKLLHENELLVLVKENEEYFLEEEQLPHFEHLIRLHVELEVNVPGIEVIENLLEQHELDHARIVALKNRLSFFENED